MKHYLMGASSATDTPYATTWLAHSAVKSALRAFGTISIFMLAPLIIPLAVLLGLIAIIHGQWIYIVLSITCAALWFRYFTHPFVLRDGADG